MRKFTQTKLFVMVVFMLSIGSMNAQSTLFEELLGQMDAPQQESFLEDLGNIQNDFELDLFQNPEILDSLIHTIIDEAPTLDNSYSDAWSTGLDYLDVGVSSNIVSPIDQDFALGIDNIFETNFDDFGSIFSDNQVDLLFNQNDAISLDYLEPEINSDLSTLQETMLAAGENTPANGLGNFSSILDQIFSPNQFPLLELAFGVQNADIKYWDKEYMVKPKLIRIGSVPRLNQQEIISIEGLWHAQASWVDEPIGGGAEIPDGVKSDIQPLLLDLSCSAIVNRFLFCSATIEGRLLTTLGAEVGTYAPAHREDFGPRNNNNKGYTTGLGAQTGVGFAIRMLDGGLSFYTLTTVAYGDVIESKRPYRYRSLKTEANVNLNNIINVRYSTGVQNWAPDQHRNVRRSHEVTIGLIIGNFNR